MAVIWAPGTKGDFARIHKFNSDAYSEAGADAIEEFVVRVGDRLRSGSGVFWDPPEIRKFRTEHPEHPDRLTYQYMLFFRTAAEGRVEIFAVYHVRENWTELLSGRSGPSA
jgi:plasmid stabilization system protein ParE